MFGKTMSIKDELMEVYFECCTDVPMDEVEKILAGKPRDAKVRLAKEIVTLYHSAKDADAAETNFDTVFKDGGVPDDMPEATVKKGSTVIDVLVAEGLISSKSEARRLIEQGGIKKDDTAIDLIEAKIEEGIYKVGKRKFLKVTVS
jgi:tyrosyl-tRNA synthetase